VRIRKSEKREESRERKERKNIPIA